MSEFYNGILENLKKEAKHLNTKLQKLRDNNDMNGYISTLRSLKDTLDLIKKYDWQLMYSKYGVVDETDSSLKNYVTEIAIWEQNHEGQIRNHKKWTTNIPYRYTEDRCTEGRPLE